MMGRITAVIFILIVLAGAVILFQEIRQGDFGFIPTPDPGGGGIGNGLNVNGGAPDYSNEITVNSPRLNEVITSPILIEGNAKGTWFFEASFPVKLYDDKGFLLGVMPAAAQGEWMTPDFVNFRVVMNFSKPSTDRGVMVFQNDNPSGEERFQKEFRVPVAFQYTGGATSTVKIFLNDMKAAEFDCRRTVGVEREVTRTSQIGLAALEALLRGPTDSERQKGYGTSINAGTGIESLKIQNGIAYADFDAEMERGMGGSCRVTAIRAQVHDTLLQFPTVKSAVISVEGRIEDILQP